MNGTDTAYRMDEADALVLDDFRTKLDGLLKAFLKNEVISDRGTRYVSALFVLAQSVLEFEAVLLSKHRMKVETLDPIWTVAANRAIDRLILAHLDTCKLPRLTCAFEDRAAELRGTFVRRAAVR